MKRRTHFRRHHGDVVPFGHFSVQSFPGCDGAVGRIDVEESLEVGVTIDGVSNANPPKNSITVTKLSTDNTCLRFPRLSGDNGFVNVRRERLEHYLGPLRKCCVSKKKTATGLRRLVCHPALFFFAMHCPPFLFLSTTVQIMQVERTVAHGFC